GRNPVAHMTLRISPRLRSSDSGGDAGIRVRSKRWGGLASPTTSWLAARSSIKSGSRFIFRSERAAWFESDTEDAAMPTRTPRVRHLPAGGRAAEAAPAPWLEWIGIPIQKRRERGDPGGQRPGERRDARNIACAARQHDGAAAPFAAVRSERVALVGAANARDCRVRLHRGRDRLSVPLEESDRLGHRAI